MPFINTSGPNEAMIRTGYCIDDMTIKIGGLLYSLPWIHEVNRLDLNMITVELKLKDLVTKLGVKLNIEAVSQLRIAKNEEMVKLAAQIFMNKSNYEITSILQKSLEGYLRSICSGLTVEEINADRPKFIQAVKDVMMADLGNFGIELLSYTVRDISDNVDYMNSLGIARTSQIKRDARIGEAEALRGQAVREAETRATEQASRLQNAIQVASAKRDYDMKEAANQYQVQTKKAEADLANLLQQAKTQQLIKAEEMQVEVVSRQKALQIETQECLRKEQELDATIRQPAEAEAYRMRTIAEGECTQRLKEAEAEAETTRKIGLAEAQVERVKALALAKEMYEGAKAKSGLEHGAYVEMMLDQMPRIAQHIGDALTTRARTTILDLGGDDESETSGLGAASKLTKEVEDIMATLPMAFECLTGLAVTEQLAEMKKNSNLTAEL